MVAPQISKKDTQMRINIIAIRDKLLVTMRYLITLSADRRQNTALHNAFLDNFYSPSNGRHS